MAEMQIPLIKGDKVDDTTDYRDALPVNMSGVVKPILGAQGYMLQQPGLTEYGASVLDVTLANHTIDTGDEYPDGAEAIYRLNTNGLAQYSIDGGSTYSDYTGEWLESGAASEFECRMDIVSGAFTSGTTGSWLSLSSTRSWGILVASGDGTDTVEGTISIRRADTEVVLDTATINLTAQSIQPVFDYVTFDGTNDYMTLNSDLTGNTNGKVGTIVARIKLTGNDGANRSVVEGNPIIGAQNNFQFVFLSSDIMQISCTNVGDTSQPLYIVSQTTYTATGTWLNILASWDCENDTEGQLYVNDVDDIDSGASDLDNEVLAYEQERWSVGAEYSGSAKLSADVGFIWFDQTTAIDFAVEANRRLFFDAGGCPVDLGTNGEIPTGTAPILYVGGNSASFPTNKGTGGGFTLTGTLTGGTYTCP